MSASATHRDSDIIEVPRLGHRQMEILSDVAWHRLSIWLDIRGGHYRWFLQSSEGVRFARAEEAERIYSLVDKGLLAVVADVDNRVVATDFGRAAFGLPEPDLKPGSAESVHRGCRCAVIDNRQGRGMIDGMYVMNEACPIHGQGVEEGS